MKQFKIFVTMCMVLLSINSIAQNVGINNTNPQAALDLQGDLRLRSALLTLPNGLNNDVDLTTTKSSVYMFAGGALAIGGAQITGFTGGVDGRIVTIFNNSTTGAIQLYDASFSVSPSAASNKILTGTGSNAIIYGNGSVTLRYDGAKAKWIVQSSTYTDGLSLVTAGSGPWTVTGNNISNSNSANVGIGTSTPVNKMDVQTSANGVITLSGTSNGQFGYGVYGRSNNSGIGVLGEAYIGNAVGGYFIADGLGNEKALKAETLNGGTAAYFNSPTGNAIIVDQGNVGIAEPTPSEKLQVNNGNIKIGKALWASAADDRFLKIGDGPYVSIGEVGGDDLMEVRGKEITVRSNPATSGPFGSSPAGNVLIPNGRVAIGASGAEITSPLSFKNILGKKISLYSGGANNEFGFGIQTGELQLYTAGQDMIGFGYGSSNNFTRTMAFYPGSAQLAINGLPSVGYHLTVNGNVRTKEVVVETGWADYVFAKDYKLPSLTDVEKYIKANNHLPEIPSAEEIQTNGLKVGEVQTKMMQKIEELTLYIIEMKKEIELLKLKTK
jgi:hypothetical protein